MAFMLAVTLTSLCMTIVNKVSALATAGPALGTILQLIIAVLLVILAVILAIKGVRVIASKKSAKAAA
jgi:carbon starvation protein